MSSSSEPLNVVVLITGSGSNLQALIDALPTFENPRAVITLVASNSKYAYGIHRALSANPPIPTQVFSLASFRKQHPEWTDEAHLRLHYDRELASIVKAARPHLVILAGFMHILSAEFLTAMRAHWSTSHTSPIPVINLHPALPGQFDGANAIRRAWEAGPSGSNQISHTGVMVHEVIPEVDRGSPIVTQEVELKKEESLESFEKRMHAVEHQLITQAARLMLRRIDSPSQHTS